MWCGVSEVLSAGLSFLADQWGGFGGDCGVGGFFVDRFLYESRET